jgi:hypothetical protein
MFAGVEEIEELVTKTDTETGYPPIWYIPLKLNSIKEIQGFSGVSLHQECR